MKVTILAVGKIKEKYFTLAIEEYVKRLQKFAKVNIIELNDEKAPENLSLSQTATIKKLEGRRVLKNIGPDGFVFALEISGAKYTSEGFAELISAKKLSGYSHFYFIIGGSLGLSKEVLDRADLKISFSDMTFPHQLMRVILLEQIYRAHKICANEPYHK
ncbi:MAG: 23S rRNA (pseudouridine(1915)-N(3))-methyltransferase RlmH [Clostridiales bacterium]|jgi:23S rRNA (pseudouridine1915-N3)-methyltransferase|nr:23S rRNA (pseudouridine(1915)-N(3))-methyltransferase RlmH [Clostridiales bacterium]